MNFAAEIREVKAYKTVSLDREIRVVLNTWDVQAIDLAKIPTDSVVTVRIEVQDGQSGQTAAIQNPRGIAEED